MTRLDETIYRVNNPGKFKVTVNGQEVHMCSKLELDTIDLLQNLDASFDDRALHSVLQWLVKQIKAGKVPICPK